MDIDVSKEYGIDSSTIEGYMLAAMVNRGLFPDQAAQILESVKASEVSKVIQGRWSDKVEAYHPGFLSVIWTEVSDEAVRWIEKNCPQHWAKSLFTGEAPGGPSAGPA